MTFDTTHWSVVSAIRSDDPDVKRRALDKTCARYWDPICRTLVRAWSYRPDEAQDLTQTFFLNLIEHRQLEAARRDRGPFHQFLIVVLEHVVINDEKYRRRLKRGGGERLLELDATTAHGRSVLEPIDQDTPERIFEQEYAQSVFDRVTRRLEQEWRAAGAGAAFAVLRPYLNHDLPPGGYHELAGPLGVSDEAARSQLRRLQSRFLHLLRKDVAASGVMKEDIDGELRFLAKAWRPL
jgi:DNA-directed RNA polymerase specialized sigma24 family protein